MQTMTTIGLDIAKSVFQVHGVDANGKVILRRPCRIAAHSADQVEANGGATLPFACAVQNQAYVLAYIDGFMISALAAVDAASAHPGRYLC